MKLKNCFQFFSIAILLASCSTSKNTNKPNDLNQYPWFPFSWYSADISGKYFDKLAILVHTKVNDLNADFTLQFDLGSNSTSIYGNTIGSYYPENEIKSMIIESTKSTTDAGRIVYDTKGLTYHLGKFSINDVAIIDKYGESIHKDSLFTKTSKHIGTLGANVFKNKILIIDYPQQKMCVLDSLDSYWEGRVTFVQAQSKRGRLHIPLEIGGNTYWFLFDTGASLFPVNTNKELWSRIVDGSAKTDTLIGNSWGEKVTFYGRPIKENVYLGKRLLKKSIAWYNENKRLQEFNKSENIDGLTGNAYFTNDIIVLDFKNTRFGIAD